MDNRQAHASNLEEEWILKYRDALKAVPTQKSPRTLRTFFEAYSRTVMSTGKIVVQWIQASLSKPKDTPRTRSAQKKPLQTPPPQEIQSRGFREKISKKAS